MDATRKENQLLRPSKENAAVLKEAAPLKAVDAKPKYHGSHRKAKFRIFGEEMIEKEVRPAGNSGRVYLPLDWVGKHVKIVRVD
jgi:putative transposon-encoded protein